MINERLKQLLVAWLSIDESFIEPEADLIDDLGVDSIKLVEVVMALEDEFNMRIPAADVQKIRTIQDLNDYLGKRLGQA